jgi:lysophospholipid hydrolase
MKADCILLVALADSDPHLGEYEKVILNWKTSARKELVLIHSERDLVTGSTRSWLKARSWVNRHHHVLFHTPLPSIL